MKMSELQNGQIVRYRLGKAGETNVTWEPWKDGPIYISRRETELQQRYRRNARGTEWQTGAIITLTPLDDSWAEYGQDDFSQGVFTCEDYYMEIEKLEL